MIDFPVCNLYFVRVGDCIIISNESYLLDFDVIFGPIFNYFPSVILVKELVVTINECS